MKYGVDVYIHFSASNRIVNELIYILSLQIFLFNLFNSTTK